MNIGNFNLQKDGVFIIAEMSANHGNDINTALETIKAAKEIGANAIKLQTYSPETMTLNCNNKEFVANPNGAWAGTKLYDLYKEAMLPWEWHEELFNYARKIGIDIFSSPFDKSAVDFLEQFNPSAYKIASFEITDYELIRYTASKMKPIIISTGIASIDEIQDAVDICRSENNHNIVILKCTSAYPASFEEANLLTIPNMRDTFGVISGFSDHTLGNTAPITATVLGAKVIEKHFILDKSIGGADSHFSMDRDEFASMIKEIRNTEKLLGKVDYSMDEKKKNARHSSRSIYIAKDIKLGERFTNENLKTVRPGYGLHPKYLQNILGTKAKKAYTLGDKAELI